MRGPRTARDRSAPPPASAQSPTASPSRCSRSSDTRSAAASTTAMRRAWKPAGAGRRSFQSPSSGGTNRLTRRGATRFSTPSARMSGGRSCSTARRCGSSTRIARGRGTSSSSISHCSRTMPTRSRCSGKSGAPSRSPHHRGSSIAPWTRARGMEPRSARRSAAECSTRSSCCCARSAAAAVTSASSCSSSSRSRCCIASCSCSLPRRAGWFRSGIPSTATATRSIRLSPP